ncbi:type VI immunity family protein [Pseudomonas monteilii]|jgi:hypothetical protein|uniref:type VI immunity family protein n=1 Tax=Pseudomonas monteilii TaxID=76759 RepID=UPI002829D19E|nr:DUF3396 domain-containing protein [Pseudomonas sp.]
MSEDEFNKAFASHRNDFVYYDELDGESVVINVGLVASFQITKSYTPEGRQRIVDAVEIFCRYHGDKLKWGYRGAEDMLAHDYSPASVKATLAYLAGDGFAEPLAFRWASVEGYGNVPDYMIDGYSPAGWMEEVHGTFTTLRFYLPVEEILQGRKERFEALLHEMCCALEPLHAAAGLGVQHTYQWEDFQHVEYEVAMTYQGLDLARPRGNPSWRSGYSNLNWYTYINSAWMSKLGTQDALLAKLDDIRIGVQYLPKGTLLRAGDWPALWKVGFNEKPEHYVRVNELIKSLRVEDIGALHYGSIAGETRMTQLISNAWLRRFDLPPGKALPTTPLRYRYVSAAEREQVANRKRTLDDFLATSNTKLPGS